jgi:hypothetical protein
LRFVGVVEIRNCGINRGGGGVLICLGFKCVDKEIRQDEERSKSLNQTPLVVLPRNNLTVQTHQWLATSFLHVIMVHIPHLLCINGAASMDDWQHALPTSKTFLWCAKVGANKPGVFASLACPVPSACSSYEFGQPDGAKQNQEARSGNAPPLPLKK